MPRDGDQCLVVADVPEHAERVAAELLDTEQHQLRIARGKHVGPIDPALVEFERLGIGRADHRAVGIDEADVLHGGALIDVEADCLERGGGACGEPAAGQLVKARGREVDGEFGPAQHDFGQLVELARLLIPDEPRRRDMTDERKRSHARKHERRQ